MHFRMRTSLFVSMSRSMSTARSMSAAKSLSTAIGVDDIFMVDEVVDESPSWEMTDMLEVDAAQSVSHLMI